ncbi:MAG: hypothetical protein ABIF18_01845 [archaeon]
MKSKIIKQEKNPFLEREELILEITNETAPTLDDAKKEIKGNADLTVVKKIKGNFGKQIFTVEAVIYNNVEAKEKIETIPQKVRKKIEADKKAEEETKKKAEEADKKAEEEAKVAKEKVETVEETPAEEKAEEPKAEETPAEEKVEETKTEEKKE